MTTFIALAPDPEQQDISYFVCLAGDHATRILEFRTNTTINKDVTLHNVPTFVLDSGMIEFARTGMLVKANMTLQCKVDLDGLYTCTKSRRFYNKDIVLSVRPNNRMYVSKTFPSGTYTLSQSLPVVEEISTQIKICLVQLDGPNMSPALLPRTKPALLPELCADQKANPTPSTSSAHNNRDQPGTTSLNPDSRTLSIQSGLTISEIDQMQGSSGPTVEEPASMDIFSPLALSTGGIPVDIVDIPKKTAKRSPYRPSTKGKSATGVGKSSLPRKLKPSYPDLSKDLRLTIDPSRDIVTFTLDPAIANNKHGELVIRKDTLNSSWCGAGSGFLMDPTPSESTENSTRRTRMKRKQSIAPWPHKRSLAPIIDNNEDNATGYSHQASPNNNPPKGRNETSNHPSESIPLSTVGKEKFWCKDKLQDRVREWMSSNPSPDSPDSTTNNNQDLSVYSKSFTRTDEHSDTDTLPDSDPVTTASGHPRSHDNTDPTDTMITLHTQDASKIQLDDSYTIRIETHHGSNNNNSSRDTSGPNRSGNQKSPTQSTSTDISTPKNKQKSETLLGPGDSTDQYYCDVSDQTNSPAKASPSSNSSAVTLNDSDLALLNAINSLQRQGTSVIFPGSTGNARAKSSGSNLGPKTQGGGEGASHE